MTLLDIFPSLRSAMSPRLDPAVWPINTHHDDHGRITVGGVALADIADQYGTPSYVIDELDVRHRCRTYREIFPEAEIAYAGEALMTRALASWVSQEGLSLNVCSAGEMAIALSAGVDPRRIIMHGNAKTPVELTAALDAGVGRIVIDSHTEIVVLAAALDHKQDVLVRVTPDLEVHGHRAVRTGVADQKFGFPIENGQADAAVKRVIDQPHLNLVGLHCDMGSEIRDMGSEIRHLGSEIRHLGSEIRHLGSQIRHLDSQITEPEHFATVVRRMIAQMAQVYHDHGLILTELNLGGGHAVSYGFDGVAPDLTQLASILEDALDDACARHRFPRPRITLEPGRAIVARSGVTVYRVVSVKHIEGGRTFVCVDGGMSDNPRVCLYAARDGVALANRHPVGAQVPVTVAGRHCESGDELAVDVPLPADLHPGDVLAIPGTGAYHHSLASKYNSVGRPPIIAVCNGSARELIRRETLDDLLRRESSL